jgi:hypothetical protein
MSALRGKVALVTGAVYITGRTVDEGHGAVPIPVFYDIFRQRIVEGSTMTGLKG